MTELRTAALVDALRAAGVFVSTSGAVPPVFSDVADDSRAATSGALFVAIPGTGADGHDFIAKAHVAGATAAVVTRAAAWPLPVIVVTDARSAAAIAAAMAHGDPAGGLTLIAVTGTNGKSTTVHLARAILDTTLGPAVSLGTLGALRGVDGVPITQDAGLTTPGPVALQRALRLSADSGALYVALEVSSHSLDQHRVAGLTFAVGVFTTFTRDHLDYHRTMESYFAAKARLLEQIAPDGVVIVNSDDPAWQRLPRKHRTLTYGRGSRANVRAEEVALDARGSHWSLRVDRDSAKVELPLIGEFNVDNALAAAAIAHALGAPVAAIAEALSRAPQVPGRLEVIADSPLVLRDYAHTPDALEGALRAVRPLVSGRLILLFGCGGDRDKGKRPLMGAIAARLADVVIVTSDNPRTEDPEAIIDDIVRAMPAGSYERIEDRRAAIERALALAAPGDAVLLAGKGHEAYQVRGTEKLHFDEKEIVGELLAVGR